MSMPSSVLVCPLPSNVMAPDEEVTMREVLLSTMVPWELNVILPLTELINWMALMPPLVCNKALPCWLMPVVI